MNGVMYLAINTIAVLVAANVMPGIHIGGVWQAFVAAVVLAVVMTVIRPILLALTLPLNVLTLGLFTFVINALLVLFVARVVPGFAVDSFWWALGFSLVLALVNSALHASFPPRNIERHA